MRTIGNQAEITRFLAIVRTVEKPLVSQSTSKQSKTHLLFLEIIETTEKPLATPRDGKCLSQNPISLGNPPRSISLCLSQQSNRRYNVVYINQPRSGFVLRPLKVQTPGESIAYENETVN